jgi:serine/threonine protein kinase
MSDQSDEALEGLPRGASEPLDAPVRRAIQAGVVLADRFEVTDKLGAGGMGQVFAAFDRTRQARVAIKIIGRLTPRSIRELKREFRAASELVHPNLVPLHQLFCDDVEWLFSMDLIDGVTLATLGKPPPESLLRDVLRQLGVALSVLHKAGTLHGDLKPSNFLITPHHRVVLLDFGLARPIGLAQDRDFAGTPGYMPPEQLVGGLLTEAADWYSFGVVLYEALTGVLPFRLPLEKRLAQAPDDLRALCLELLRFAPNERPKGDDVLRRLGVSPAETRFFDVLPVSRRGGLVNRHAELAALHRELQTARTGQTAVALLHGPSGIGKTALVEAFVHTACSQGARLLSSRCRERESMGYKAADGLVDDIVRFLDGLEESEAAELVPEGIEDLVVLFPALNAAGAVERAPKKRIESGDQTLVRVRAIAAFHKLFERLSARAPLIVWMDDLQWSDSESALLLGSLLRPSRALPLLFIGTYRTTPHGRGPMLDALFEGAAAFPAPTELPLAPLSPEASERLALEALPLDEPDALTIARNIGRDAGGHPLFIAELAHAVGFSESLAAGGPPATLLELVQNRVAALPAEARELLELTAVAGVPLSRSVLRHAHGLSFVRAEEALDLLRALRLVRSHGPNEDDAIDTHHDRIREIVAQQLDDTDRRAHHKGLARVLEEDPRTKPDRLAVHHQASGDLPRAGRYWITAADQALRALAFEHAADLYGKGLDLAALDPTERRAVQIRRAEALGFAGRGPAAADAFLETSASCARDEALELRRRAAEQLLLSGHLARGLRVIDGVLESLGMRESGDSPRDLVAIARGRIRVRLRGLRHVARTESELPRDELARLDASWTLACSLSLIDPMRGATFQSRHLLLALKAGEPRRLLRALTLEMSYAATPGVGSERRTARVLEVADALVHNQSDYAAIALLSLARGIVAHLQGHVENALTHSEAALKVLAERCAGAVWETLSAQRFAIAALFFLGRLRRLGEFVGPLLAAAEGTGNLYATMCFRAGYTTVAWLAQDRVDEARRQLDLARDEWKDTSAAPLFRFNVLIGATFVDLYTGHPESALARVRAQWPTLAGAKLLRISVLRVQTWHLLAAALCQLVEARRGESDSRSAAQLRREVRQIAKRLRGERIPRAAALADLVESAIDRSEGDIRSSERRLRQCIAAFDDLGMRLFSAAARVRLGEVTGDGAGEALADTGYAEFGREGVVNPSRMVDLLAPGFGASQRSIMASG